jgi:DNA-binding transcriptional MerR regulator
MAMRIGELAKTAEVPAKTIRYYEDIGLLPRPARTEGGYRRYGAEAAELLRFIRKAQAIGLTLSEIRELAEIRGAGNLPCVHLRSLLEAKVADLEARIRELQKLRGEMRRTLDAWDARLKDGQSAVVCPHIEARPDGATAGPAFRSPAKGKKPRGIAGPLVARAGEKR